MKTTSLPSNSVSRVSSLILGLSLCLGIICRADDAGQTATSGVLLLKENRVVQGRIQPQGETYAVEQPAGTLIVSRDQVRFVGDTLHAVYVYLEGELPKAPSANEHLDLARWCIENKLNSEARFELQRGLEAEPDREDIRRNLVRLDTLLKRGPREPAKAKPETPAERLAKSTLGLNTDVESLAGLTREAGQEFTRKIQPILIHNCANASCHGPRSDHAFKLDRAGQGTLAARTTTEKNLLALLAYVDQDHPKQGELWKVLKSNHGAKGRSIFAGTKGSDQLKSMQDWMLSLDKEPDRDEVAPTRSKVFSPFAVQQASHTTEEKPRWRKGGPRVPLKDPKKNPKDDVPPTPEVLVPTSPRSKLPATTTAKSNSSPTKPRAAKAPDVDPIISTDRPDESIELPPDDPFNPDEFNSRQRIKKNLGP